MSELTSWMRLSRRRALVLLLVCAACGRKDPREAGVRAPPPGEAAVDRPHVVFSDSELVISRLETPVQPRVSTGSRPSPRTLRSTAPEVVAVAPDGSLVAHQNGDADVETRNGEGARLHVKVRVAERLALAPEYLLLEPGQKAALRAKTSPVEVPPEAISWGTDDTRALSVIGGAVQAGDKPGIHKVFARYGGEEAWSVVEVKSAARQTLHLAPAVARLRIGEVRAFQAIAKAGPVVAVWTSRKSAVAAVLGGGLVLARAVGIGQVCATAGGGEACSNIEVVP